MSKDLSRLATDIIAILSTKPKTVCDSLLADLDYLCEHFQIASENTPLHEKTTNLLEKMSQKSSFLPFGVNNDFARYSTCSASDLHSPKFLNYMLLLGHRAPAFHRKHWEWAIIIHNLLEQGVLTHGKRGVAFGVGKEMLPALFSKFGVHILATDAPTDHGIWTSGGQYSNCLDDLYYDHLVESDDFHRLVSYSPCDMNNIPDGISDFDFMWSSCCLEHLGSLRAGMDFIVNSLERCLKPGGFAIHTTEFNLSSDTETITSGPTVLYRLRDMQELVCRLRMRGHEVNDFIVAPDSHFLDMHIDLPPYGSNPHIRLQIEGYAATSAALLIKKSKSMR